MVILMSQLSWLHLSDIHFNPKMKWRDSHSQDTLLEYLAQCFRDEPHLRPDLIFCTGDIAFGQLTDAPLSGQFDAAKAFFNELLMVCGRDGAPLSVERLYVVPGNHDVNREKINSDAQQTIYANALAVTDEKVIEMNNRFAKTSFEFKQMAMRLDEYRQFVADFLPHQLDSGGRDCYAKTLEISIGGHILKLGVAGLNSAWSCAGDEDDRKIWLAASWQMNQANAVLKAAQLRIALMHHPVDNLNQAERQFMAGRLAVDFDFLLHGHSHSAWVDPSTCVTVAAGAVGAATKDEFGVNFVALDLSTGKGKVYLHKYDGNGWTKMLVTKLAPEGIWPFDLGKIVLPELAKGNGSIAHQPLVLSAKLYGRAGMLADCTNKLQKHPLLLLYGMRGNGKSSLIDELAQHAPLVGLLKVRFSMYADTTPDMMFRHIIHLFGDRSEQPRVPEGEPAAIAAELLRRYPKPVAAWLWLDRAHLLLDKNGFKQAAMRKWLLGLHLAYGMQMPLVFELWERPPKALLGVNTQECEVLGLDKESLRDFLAEAAPPGKEDDWHFKGDQLKRVYQWLGGGGGNHANPLATSLLIEVANAKQETPVEVLLRHSGDAKRRIEDELLGELFSNVLNGAEQKMIQALALYRGAFPADHIELLENELQLPHAWDGIDRRCLLAVSGENTQLQYYLHGFVVDWLGTKLGYVQADQTQESRFAPDVTGQAKTLARQLHGAIAACWLAQIKGKLRALPVNIAKALEAFHHLNEAEQFERLQEISVDLLGGNRDYAVLRMSRLADKLFQEKASIKLRRQVLQYWVQLAPDDHKAWRFLGETWAKEEGWNSQNVLPCFENATELHPTFPQYWANLGTCLLARGDDGAREFLVRVEKVARDYPQAINDYVLAVQINCLMQLKEYEMASRLRMEKINAGSRDPAFYADEAKARLSAGDAQGALQILDLADQRQCGNDTTAAIRSSALKADGQAGAADLLRMAKINEGSRNPAHYNDEAKARMARGDTVGALAILDLASERRCADDHTDAIRADALDQLGQTDAGSRLRMEKINDGSRSPVFYNVEAQSLLASGDAVGALALLDRASQRGCTDKYTDTIRTRAKNLLARTRPA
jgi:predicted phosphodiesterase/tetratricopeptide (TPR) repeat protein